MKLVVCSIAIAVLIGKLQADEVTAYFFKSNTHLVKEFGDKKNLDSKANQFLIYMHVVEHELDEQWNGKENN